MEFSLICSLFVTFFTLSIALKSSRLPKDNNSRIVGGAEINISSAPYQASLQFFGFHICGGSIISNKYILTAAHVSRRLLVFKSLIIILIF